MIKLPFSQQEHLQIFPILLDENKRPSLKWRSINLEGEIMAESCQ